MTTIPASRPRKPKKCKACREPFLPARPLQSVCGPQCALTLISRDAQRENNRLVRAERKAIREAKQKAKTRSQWMKEAQAEFNRWIRFRDAGLPCISCGSMPEQRYGGTIDCGHYRSTGAAPHLRFTPANAAAQCVKCNRHLGGNAVAFRAGLVARIGLDAVEALEADHEARKYSIDDLKAIKAEYVAKRKALEAGR